MLGIQCVLYSSAEDKKPKVFCIARMLRLIGLSDDLHRRYIALKEVHSITQKNTKDGRMSPKMAKYSNNSNVCAFLPSDATRYMLLVACCYNISIYVNSVPKQFEPVPFCNIFQDLVRTS